MTHKDKLWALDFGCKFSGHSEIKILSSLRNMFGKYSADRPSLSVQVINKVMRLITLLSLERLRMTCVTDKHKMLFIVSIRIFSEGNCDTSFDTLDTSFTVLCKTSIWWQSKQKGCQENYHDTVNKTVRAMKCMCKKKRFHPYTMSQWSFTLMWSHQPFWYFI